VVSVKPGQVQSKAGIRTVTLPPDTMQALAEHRAQQVIDKLAPGGRYRDQGFVFANQYGDPADLHSITKRHFVPLLEAAGIPRIRLYDLRHTHASRMLTAGVPVQVVWLVWVTCREVDAGCLLP
jgi:integrase